MQTPCTAGLQTLNDFLELQSRIVRGLLPPLATLTAEAVAVALYETLREVSVAAGINQ